MDSTSLLERPGARGIRNPKVVCAVTLVLVFLSGAVVGALAMDRRIHNRPRISAFDTPEGRALYLQRVTQELNLTPEQSEQMRSVLQDLWQYYRNVLNDSKQRVELLLTEEQKRKFEKILQQPPR